MEAVGDEHADVAGPGVAGLCAATDDELAGGGALRNTGDDERIGADDDRRADIADGHPGAFFLREALASDLQFAARNRRGRSDLGDERPGIAGLRRGIFSKD